MWSQACTFIYNYHQCIHDNRRKSTGSSRPDPHNLSSGLVHRPTVLAMLQMLTSDTSGPAGEIGCMHAPKDGTVFRRALFSSLYEPIPESRTARPEKAGSKPAGSAQSACSMDCPVSVGVVLLAMSGAFTLAWHTSATGMQTPPHVSAVNCQRSCPSAFRVCILFSVQACMLSDGRECCSSCCCRAVETEAKISYDRAADPWAAGFREAHLIEPDFRAACLG